LIVTIDLQGRNMDTRKILSELRAERNRIDQAIAALEALDTTAATPAARTNKPGPKPRGPKPGGRRHMSAAGRQRISEMMKKRWAERRKRAKAA
jgi:hypothetical protein